MSSRTPYFLSRCPERIFLLRVPKLIRGSGLRPTTAHTALEKCGDFMVSSRLRPNTLLRREKALNVECLCTVRFCTFRSRLHDMCRAGVLATFGSLDRVGRLRLSRGRFHLALDLLHGCGMMQQSEEGFLAGFEARDLKNSRAASLHSAKNTRYVLPGLGSKLSSRW